MVPSVVMLACPTYPASMFTTTAPVAGVAVMRFKVPETDETPAVGVGKT
jgi:hypothetical protein